jgi:hypothetical protein
MCTDVYAKAFHKAFANQGPPGEWEEDKRRLLVTQARALASQSRVRRYEMRQDDYTAVSAWLVSARNGNEIWFAPDISIKNTHRQSCEAFQSYCSGALAKTSTFVQGLTGSPEFASIVARSNGGPIDVVAVSHPEHYEDYVMWMGRVYSPYEFSREVLRRVRAQYLIHAVDPTVTRVKDNVYQVVMRGVGCYSVYLCNCPQEADSVHLIRDAMHTISVFDADQDTACRTDAFTVMGSINSSGCFHIDVTFV